MSPVSRIIFAIVIILSFSFSAMAQNQKKVTYEFYLMQVKSKEAASKLDSIYIKKKGIISAQTDATTKKVTITCITAIDFTALKAIAVNSGFEVSEENIVRTEIKQE